MKRGASRVIIRLSADSGAVAFAKGGNSVQAKQAAKAQQDSFLELVRAADPNARLIARVQIVLNAIFVEVDASILPQLSTDPAVLRIAPVGNYETDLFETVPYIGAADVQELHGFTGKGIKVAVLDSGIDYTHAALGGSGDPADFANNDPTVIEPGTFPTAKVVGGYDFVGSIWPNGRRMHPIPIPLMMVLAPVTARM
jgi:subtilisin family serine protease